ncbi:ATP-binding protein [Streptomyces sp. NPDC021354]|uniref:ATP-binding protein n=1 Tax=Streptomyces sp. NPDC021354 TaxID=3154793 RepID=UPI003406F880
MHEYMSSARAWGLTCPGFPEEIGRARRWTRDILSDHPCADIAALIVSELSTNAVTHTASGSPTGTFHVALALSAQVVAISVTDAGGQPGKPHPIEPDQDATHGRGLSIVMALAHHLGITGDEHGHTVTAELLTPAAAACTPEGEAR